MKQTQNIESSKVFEETTSLSSCIIQLMLWIRWKYVLSVVGYHRTVLQTSFFKQESRKTLTFLRVKSRWANVLAYLGRIMYKKAKSLFACRDQSTLFLPNRIHHFTMLLNGTFMQFSLNMLESFLYVSVFYQPSSGKWGCDHFVFLKRTKPPYIYRTINLKA